MRNFVLVREEDETGISGTGTVAEGVQFANGKCVMNWLSEHTSVAIYDDIATLEAIHGHNGKTKVVWIDIDYKDFAPSAIVWALNQSVAKDIKLKGYSANTKPDVADILHDTLVFSIPSHTVQPEVEIYVEDVESELLKIIDITLRSMILKAWIDSDNEN